MGGGGSPISGLDGELSHPDDRGSTPIPGPEGVPHSRSRGGYPILGPDGWVP